MKSITCIRLVVLVLGSLLSAASLDAQSASSFWDFIIADDGSSTADFFNVVDGDPGSGVCIPTIHEESQATVFGPSGSSVGPTMTALAPNSARSDAAMGLTDGAYTLRNVSIAYATGCGGTLKLLETASSIPITVRIGITIATNPLPLIVGCYYRTLACNPGTTASCPNPVAIATYSASNCPQYSASTMIVVQILGLTQCSIAESVPTNGPGDCR